MATHDTIDLVFERVLTPAFSWTDRIDSPAEWPVYVRRAFLLTLPLSGLVWCAICALLATTVMLVALTCIASVVIGRRIAAIWRRIGPATERRCMWFKTMWES